MSKIRYAVVGVLLLAATACTPEEVAFWTAYYAEHPDEAVQHPVEPSPPPAAVETMFGSHPPHTVTLNCPDFTLTVTNTSLKPEMLTVTYGPTQTPIGPLATELDEGASVTVPLSPADGTTVMVFLDNGAVARITDAHC